MIELLLRDRDKTQAAWSITDDRNMAPYQFLDPKAIIEFLTFKCVILIVMKMFFTFYFFYFFNFP